MKIKKFGKAMVAVILGATMGLSTLAFAGCGEKTPQGPGIDIEDPTNGTITVTADKDELKVGSGESVNISVTVTGLTNKTYDLTLEGEGASYVTLNGNVLSFKEGLKPTIRMSVTVVAISTVTNTVKGTKSITLVPQVISGNVEDLKTEMFTELGNPSITVSGVVTDIYRDYTDSSKDVTNNYDYLVKMEDGKWYGEWGREGSNDKDIKHYRRAAEKDETGKYPLEQAFVDKNNKESFKLVKNYLSEPAYWENQHFWNHLADLGNNIEVQWEYDETNDAYLYKPDDSFTAEGDFSSDAYLRTYLAFSLTPMLEDTFATIKLTLDKESGKITQMVAETEKITEKQYNSETNTEKILSVKYTTVTLNFTEVGTTEVPKVEAFTVKEGEEAYIQALDSALKNMGKATNYTFEAVETTISAPPINPDDYTTESVKRARVANGKDSTGKEGLSGQVTEDAVLLKKTGKYSAGMDDKLYWYEYSGYKKIDENTYDYFEYDSSIGALKGKKQFKGDLFDIMPKFDFSAEVFEYAGSSEIQINGKWTPVRNYVLREQAITRDIAMEVSMHSYAKDAEGSTFGAFKITILDDGENSSVISTQIPYSLIAGTYVGVIETTYSKVGTTTLPEDTFDGYEAREVRKTWNDFEVMYYHADHTTQSGYGEMDAGTLLEQMFGNESKKFPAPTVFSDIFGDNLTNCFFQWDDLKDPNTGVLLGYRDWFSFNLRVEAEYADENSMVDYATYKSFMDKLTAELAKSGFTVSAANTGVQPWGDRYNTFINGNMVIRVTNNRTWNISVDVFDISKLNG